MSATLKEIRLRGRVTKVPALLVENRTVLSIGRWVRMASVHDEAWLEGETLKNPEEALLRIRAGLSADVFTFAQKIPNTKPKYSYRLHWDNVAAIPLTNYQNWWEGQIPQESRKNVRRSARRGVMVKECSLDDEFVRGISEIYNETPIRQGKRFYKYGQSFDEIKADASQLLERSKFFGAYHQEELIGFVKLVFIDNVASILSINAKSCHFDKRPTNALLAKVVEASIASKATHLLYGRYTYGNKKSSPLTEFKRRNGFIQIDVPRYYIPLTRRGHLILQTNAHLGVVGMLPGSVLELLLKMRAHLFEGLKHGNPEREVGN